MSAEQVTGADVSVCRTKPIPAEQYQPLMRNLWKVIDEIVPDLLAALRRTDELNNSPFLPWWGNVNQHVKSDGTSGAELVLCPGNVAPTLKAFRQVLTDSPDIVFAGAADFERRSGILFEWFSRNRERLIATGILDHIYPPAGQITRCTGTPADLVPRPRVPLATSGKTGPDNLGDLR